MPCLSCSPIGDCQDVVGVHENLGNQVCVGPLLILYVFDTGALTKGDRRAASGSDLTEFNLDTSYGRSALRNMYTAICRVGFSCCFCEIRESLMPLLQHHASSDEHLVTAH